MLNKLYPVLQKIFPNYFIKLFLKLGILILIYSLCRVVFLVINNASFPVVYFTDFLAGIWFDAVTGAIVMLPLVALETFPNKWRDKKFYKAVLLITFNIILFLTVLINLIDAEFFKHTSSRSTSSLFKILGFSGGDFATQTATYIKDYWYLILFLILFIFLGNWLYKRVNRIPDDSKTTKWLHQSLIFPVSTFIFIILGRGGFGLKPIAPPHAASYTVNQNVQLVLNSAFTVIKTWGNVTLDEKDYFEEAELKQLFDPIKQYNNPPILQHDNIVILILESFSVEYIGAINGEETYTPFLDSLIGTSLVYTNCYANGKKSIDAVPSIISSIPKLMELEYLASSYAANQVESIPRVLAKKGYESGFFHGATNGSMNFDVYADVSSFDKYYGRTEYKNEADFDGTWGIYDDKFFKWSVDQFSAMKKPFFSTVFSISSHHPYTIPAEFGDRFSKGPALINDAVRYSDHSLRLFFEAAKQTEWYDNTLFIIVADHTPASGTPIYFKEMGNMHVPLVFYHPTNNYFKGRSDKVVSQVDIMPSILHLLGHHDPFFSFGSSVFKDEPGQSTSFVGEKFLYFGTYQDEHYLMTYLDDKPLGLYDLKDVLQSVNLLDRIEVTTALENRLKALIQTYNHALINNQMIIRDK